MNGKRAFAFSCRTGLMSVVVAMIVAPPASAVPSFEGIWSTDREASNIWPEDPGFTPRGRETFDNHDPTTGDPALYCAVYMPRVMVGWGRKPMEIFQADDRLWTLHERMHQVRRIYLDGRPPPEDEGATWMGHSTGFWDGDTLVVETVNMRESIYNWSGLPLSGEHRVVERITLLDEETLEVLLTIIDPVNYEEPWTTRNIWRLTPDIHFYEYECQ
ncbi:MAG: hypothetical protein OXQ29_22300 [Rhodospirillaceae bacterium]|nr:hypothetical protein [Rhodospirillaceae bacterium]